MAVSKYQGSELFNTNAFNKRVDETNADITAVQGAIPTKTSQITNDSGYITSAPVTSVAGKTGAVTLSVSDVSGAQPSSSAITTSNIANQSVKWATGASTANSASSATRATYAESSANTGQVLRNQGLSSSASTPSNNGEIIWQYS